MHVSKPYTGTAAVLILRCNVVPSDNMGLCMGPSRTPLSLPASGPACPSPPPPAKQHGRHASARVVKTTTPVVADPRVESYRRDRPRTETAQSDNQHIPESSHFALYDGDLEIS